jgi:hypothetical protein
MAGPNFSARGHSIKKTRLTFILVATATLFLVLPGLMPRAHGSTNGLENLPNQFISRDGSLNCTIVVASSDGHGPSGAANTMDVMGAIMVAARISMNQTNNTLQATMDDYISTYDFGSATLTLKDTTSNLIIIGGPGVNELTWYYDNLRNGSGYRELPVYFDKDANGTDFIYVAATNHTYKIERDSQNRISADYGMILLFQDNGRYVLILAGLGGMGTWAACKIVSQFETWNLQGGAAIVRYSDNNGDGLLDTLTIVENVSQVQQISGILNPIGLGLLSTALLPKLEKLKRLKSKINGKRLLISVSVLLFLAVASQVSITGFSSGPGPNILTFKDFPQPFVSSGGIMNSSVVVASSVGHGPCGAANTMDVMGGILIAAQLGMNATGGALSSTLDGSISQYDSSSCKVTLPPQTNNLLVIGGPGVNQVTWYYNNLRNANGTRALSAYFDKDANGTDYIYVAQTNHTYKIERDANGNITADYGMITLYYDNAQGIWVLIVAGLGGAGTNAAARLLANPQNWSLFGQVTIVKYSDTNADGYLDTVSIAESVGVGKSIDVYTDATCKNRLQSIDWGTLAPGENETCNMYVRNEGANATTVTLNLTDWNPPEAPNYMNIQWSYTGYPIQSSQIVAIQLTLMVYSNITGITTFTVAIDVAAN